ncbi:MAG: hypothetical protein HY810_10665 [Candidatus Omnitrophica bacterium]|nr:hypothetical protein [Candidatus Omnitrophota bacterium]
MDKIVRCLLCVVTAVSILLTMTYLLSAQENISAEQMLISEGIVAVPLLSREFIQEHSLKLDKAFDVFNDEIILFQSEGIIFDFAGQKFLFEKEEAKLEAFALSPKGNVFTISNQQFGYYDKGKIYKTLRLPYPGMGLITADSGRVYFYQGNNPYNGIFILEADKYKQLVSMPEPVLSATVVKENIFAASGKNIYSLKNNEVPRLIFSLPNSAGKIESLAADREAEMLFFSTGSAVYVFKQGVAKEVIKGFGGQLRYSYPDLYLLNAEQGVLLRITGMEQWKGKKTAESQILGDKYPRQIKEIDKYKEFLLKDTTSVEKRIDAKKRVISITRKISEELNIPEDAVNQMRQGYAAFKEKDYFKAIEHYEMAQSLAPWWPEAYYTQGLIFENLAYQRDITYANSAYINFELFLDAVGKNDLRAEDIRKRVSDLKRIQKGLAVSKIK